MAAQQDALAGRFWDELRKHRTGMLGLPSARGAHCQPMTAFFDKLPGPLWYYTPSDSTLAKSSDTGQQGVLNYTSTGHTLYACVHGRLSLVRDEAVIERFWSDEVAKWFPDRASGQVAMLKFEPGEAQIWLPADYAKLSVVRLDE